jgi:hypothetical protein
MGGSISCSASGMRNLACVTYISCPTSGLKGGHFSLITLPLVYPYILCTSASHFSTIEVRYKSPRAMCLDLC